MLQERRTRLESIKSKVKQLKEELKALYRDMERDTLKDEPINEETEEYIIEQDELSCMEEAIDTISTTIGHLNDALRHKNEEPDSTSIEAGSN